MLTFSRLAAAQLFFVEEGEQDRLCVSTSESNYLVGACDRDHFGYWDFYLIRSGVEVNVWCETEETNPVFKRFAGEYPWHPQNALRAIEAADELYGVLLSAGVPIESRDAARVTSALAGIHVFFNDSFDCAFQWRRHVPPSPRRRRRVTQKRLDGGEDMTE